MDELKSADQPEGGSRVWVKWVVAIVVVPLAVATIPIVGPAIVGWFEESQSSQGLEQQSEAPLLQAGFDFIDPETISAAAWSNGTSPVIANNNRGDPQGHVAYMGYAGTLEDAKPAPEFLETSPEWVEHGLISGRYGPFRIPPGLGLKGEVVFLASPLASDGVTFAVLFEPLGGNQIELWSEHKIPDGKLKPFESSLSPISGQQGHLILEVYAGETSDQDWAIWRALKVVRL